MGRRGHYAVAGGFVNLAGLYVGVPGVFTAFAFAGTLTGRGQVTFSSFGLSFGPSSVEIFTIYGTTTVIGGSKTASCPTAL